MSSYLSLIRVKESFFSLPMVLAGALLALYEGFPITLSPFLGLGIIFAVFFLRTAAMCFNRVIDKDIDSLNPRTAHRLMCQGTLRSFYVWTIACLFSVFFVLSCYFIHPLCASLSPFLLTLVFLYSYCKRFTYWGHAVLALVQFFGPLMAYIAIRGVISPAILSFAIATFCWIFAMDVIYQSQDLVFDLKQGLLNLCVVLGEKGSYILAFMFHSLSIAFFILCGLLASLGFFYFIGIALAAALLGYSYYLLKNSGYSQYIFFTNNIYISFTVFSFTFLDFIWKKWL